VHNSTRCAFSSPHHSPKIQDVNTILIFVSFLEMIESAAASFPASVYEPPPESASNAPSLNVNLGGVNLSLGGPAGTGVYRTSGESSGLQADGIRGGVRSLLGKVKQGVDKIGLQ
jgi:vacuolar protein sorting-associated protein 45